VKFSFFLLALFLVSASNVGAQQGGSFFLSDIDPLLQQKRSLFDHIKVDFDLYGAGEASRISHLDNTELAGTRIGPYLLWGRPKGSKGPYRYRICIQTKTLFVDASGQSVPIGKATDVREEILDITIRPLPESEWLNSSPD
jgi:hypothetical protein